MPRRSSVTGSVFVRTTMSGPTGTVHDARVAVPRGPSISTTHIRHAPKDFMPG